jgi:hypothetical protein
MNTEVIGENSSNGELRQRSVRIAQQPRSWPLLEFAPTVNVEEVHIVLEVDLGPNHY